MLQDEAAKAVAKVLCEDLKLTDLEAQAAWEKIVAHIFAGVRAHAVVSGVCPPGGGSLTGGKIT